MRSVFLLVLSCVFAVVAGAVAAEPIVLKYSHAELVEQWRTRIQAVLDRGQLPKIDMETSVRQDQAAGEVPDVFEAMDSLGIALFAADGYQAEKDGSKGYRWSDYILDLVNRYPDRFLPVANGGTNPSWLNEKSGDQHFIAKMEVNIRSGQYVSMGEFDFRHYMSSSQCKSQHLDRDSNILMSSPNGRRVFQLSAETGVPFSAHLEPEDVALDALEEMLAAYPKAKVIVAHFGQVRHPEKETRFTSDHVRKLLSTYPNLYYDLATGEPNRKYKCAGPGNDALLTGDTVLWAGDAGSQSDTLREGWRAILTDFSDRFVFATDFGGGRPGWSRFLQERLENFDRIIRDLPDGAKQDIAYRNAWKLLTGETWK